MGIIGAAAGAISGIFGGISKNKMLKKQIAMVNNMKKENQNWYDRRYNEDSTQRADAQAMLTRIADSIRERNRQASGTAAVSGGTEESVAATKAANAQAMADAAARIAAAGENRKDLIEQQYIAKNDKYNDMLRQLKGQKSSGLDIASEAIAGAAGGLGEIDGLGEIF